MNDGFNLNLGALPQAPPPAAPVGVADRFDSPVAFKLAFVGVGQAGGRIATTFAELGYGRVCAVNTAKADMAELSLPAQSQLVLGSGDGAGKDPHFAAKVLRGRESAVADLFSVAWGDDVDYVLVCAAAGGGTGAGLAAPITAIAKQWMRDHKRPPRVGGVLALPKRVDGPRAAQNALHCLQGVSAQRPAPLLLIDNERFRELYGRNVPVSQEKPASNQATARLLHACNQLAGSPSEDVGGTTFDPTDFSRVLDSGLIAVAACTLDRWEHEADVTSALREQLERNVLSAVDLQGGKAAGLLFVLGQDAWEGPKAVPVGHLDHGTEMLQKLLQADAAVFTGVYPGKQPHGIQVLAMIGGLAYPQKRLAELAAASGQSVDAVAASLGVQ